jgi:chemotaxis protein histidine kinase CheA
LLVGAEGGIAGRPLTELLGLDARAASQFQLAYEQIFEDVLPEQVSLANLPERLCVGSRTLALTGAVVRTAGGAIRAILFSLLDISPLIDAERDAAVLRGTLAVVRHRARFGEVVRELHARLRALASAEPTAEQQEAVRLELHTAKGVFGQFSLSSLAGAIHDLEALPVVTGAHLRELDTQVAAVLEANRPLWGIDLERAEPSYELAESDLAMLEARVAAADSLEEARRAVAETSAALRRRPARELMGPLEESCAIHAARAGKRVRLVIDGGGVRWPADLAGVFAVVPHLIRNAIDHGIEPPAERGSKAAEATVRVAIEQRAEGHRIEVSDDGRGIDAGRVAARAIALGAVSPVVAAGMTAAEQRHLIFVGGLSTADEATSTSGRGVGMAAVQRAVAALGGDIAIASEPGVGTTVTLRFPR